MEQQNLQSFVNTLFPHKVYKGSVSSEALINLLSLKALYPNMDIDNITNVAIFCYKNRTDIDSLVKLSDVENFGYKIKRDKKEHFFLEVDEYSPFLKSIKKEYIFNIKDTTLPRKVTYFGQISKFQITEKYLQQIKKNFLHKTDFEIVENDNKKIEIDFQNRVISSPYKKDFQQRAKNIIASAVIFSICNGDEAIYKKIQDNAKLKEKILFDSKLISSSILRTTGINSEKKWFDENIKKEYVWGKTKEGIATKISNISEIIASCSTNLDILQTTIEHSELQAVEKEEKYIKDIFYAKKYSGHELLDDTTKQELRDRTLNEIISDSSKIEMILDNLNIEYKTHGNDFRIFNIENRNGKRKSSPDASISFYNGVYLYKNFVNDDKGNFINFVSKVKGFSYIDALNYSIETTNSRDYFLEALEDLKNQNLNDKNVTPKARLIEKIINTDVVAQNEKHLVKNMNPSELAKFKREVERRKETKENYQFKNKKKQDYEGNNISSVISYKDINLSQSSPAVNYLKQRGFDFIPNGLKEIKGKYLDKNEQARVVNGVGFLNNSGGADLKIIDNFRYGKAQSFGKKDITVFNKELLKQEHLKQRQFNVFESQWDYIAALNDEKFRKYADKSINIVLNGASNGIVQCVDLINNNKLHTTSVILFDQADDASQKVMTNIEMQVAGITDGAYLQTAQTRGKANVYRFGYSEEQLQKKMDINDLLKEAKEQNRPFYVLSNVSRNEHIEKSNNVRRVTQKIY